MSTLKTTNLQHASAASPNIVLASDGTYSAGAYGSIGFERPDKLIPYKDLTKDEVIEWVKQALGSDKVQEIGQALLNQINEQRNPTHASGMPWQ